jgi:hypothetical protein
LSDFDRETELFCTLSPSPPPGHLENRAPARIAERASIAAASRTGQFAHFRVATPIWSTNDHYLDGERMKMSGRFVKGLWRYEQIDGASHWIPLDASDR